MSPNTYESFCCELDPCDSNSHVSLCSHVDSTAASGVVPTTDAKRNRVGGTRYYDLALQCPEVKEYVRLGAQVDVTVAT